MSYIENNYVEVKTNRHSFMNAGGSLPGWLSTRGAGTVSTDAQKWGRAVLSTGTASVGDSSEIYYDSGIQPDVGIPPFDALHLSVLLQVPFSNASVANVHFGFHNGDKSNYVYHKIHDADSSEQNTIEVNENGTVSNTETRAKFSGEGPLRLDLTVDVTDEKVIHRVQDTFAVAVDIPDFDFTQFVEPEVYIQTEDTSADRKLVLYDFEVTGLRKY